ncbi:MAG: hypothetical protein KIT46_02715 [Anaerolineales bacterium]|nr:hypothetical protein [Anaerolineales bacterium]MCW5854937.1 hypothetical protein [Anaerolineales bacterium]
MPDWTNLFRWLHILGGAAWLGEVATVVFILMPYVRQLQGDQRSAFVSKVFPRVFRWASVSASTTLLAGVALNYSLTGWQNLSAYFSSARGLPILVGGALGLLLATFHFVVEGRIEPRVSLLLDTKDAAQEQRLVTFLTIVPRVGLAILVVVFLLMMIGARGY